MTKALLRHIPWILPFRFDTGIWGLKKWSKNYNYLCFEYMHWVYAKTYVFFDNNTTISFLQQNTSIQIRERAYTSSCAAFHFAFNQIYQFRLRGLRKALKNIVDIDNSLASSVNNQQLCRTFYPVSYTHLTLPTKRIV